MDFYFFSIINLCCIIGYSVISIQKAAINNTLKSKECLYVILCGEMNKCIIIVIIPQTIIMPTKSIIVASLFLKHISLQEYQYSFNAKTSQSSWGHLNVKWLD